MLNAFRHHRGRHTSDPESSRASKRCSTPFGITEGVTFASEESPNSARSAQRLSASQRASRTFGGTLPPNKVLVLNAFRHHRGRHGPRSPPSRTARRAQRLSASQRASLAQDKFNVVLPMCSTPFGITEGVTPQPVSHGPPRAVCSTPFGITEGVTGEREPIRVRGLPVLNAFRHHRGRHLSMGGKSTKQMRIECSTPFGITEGVTPLHRRLMRLSSVLNAFRHHRGRHKGSPRL